MKIESARRGSAWIRRLTPVLVLLLGVALAASAQSFTLNVVDQSDAPLAVQYRWLLQEDTTYDFVPGSAGEAALSHGFHRSYAPPVAAGDYTSGPAVIIVPDLAKRYFVSVLPAAGYTMSGAPVPANVVAGTSQVTVKVHQHPIPTAQISVRVFHDNAPINDIEDQPNEVGLAGFKITLEDAGGRYGISAGAMMMDAYGNPLGTTYDVDGNMIQMGSGVVYSDANGDALIQNLAPGKYGVSVVPPPGQGWIQTSTIEGTKINDAWVEPGEPPYFVEFGPPGVHAFFGFVQPTDDPAFFTGSSRITGQVVWVHNSRPPDFTFWPGAPVPGAWVGLNSAPAGTGVGVYAAPANEDGSFTIENVPPGTYELVVWDENLLVIFHAQDVTVTAAGDLDLGQVMVFDWFARTEHWVFEDKDRDGFRDPDEIGIPEQAINLRFRDGSVYQSFPTDGEGYVPFDETFPFFNWLVAEVDYTRFKATGLTTIVDAGGQIPPDMGWAMPSRDILNPQPQFQTDPVTGLATTTPLINPKTGNNLSRTETGPILTQGFQAFLGLTNIFEWGKAPYDPGENGGIAGIVYYASTRAEHDPALAVGEPWEPGIPRVQVNLYRAALNQASATGDLNGNGIVDNVDDFAIFDLNGSGVIELSDVDNYPFGWSDGTAAKGLEDVDQNGNGVFNQGDAVQVAWSDSWDDNLPSGAQGSNGPGFEGLDAFDGLRNFNQARPGVFDGGYAFNDIPSGIYIVEAKAPPGYQFAKEEDKNVDFGDEYQQVSVPGTGNPAMPMGPPDNVTPAQDPLDKRPILVGNLRPVPAELTLFPGIPAPFAGEMRPLPDRKQVKLNDGLNGAADFFLFTYVPVAGHIVGFVLDDLSNEFDPNAPQFGEKYSPPFIPISVRDWEGNVIAYTLTDRYGAYNALVPSTFTANRPAPSGFSPNMLTVIINDPTHPGIGTPGTPGYVAVPPNRQYSQFSYTFQYMPGTTTYLDTPVVPIAAFAGPDQFPVDVEFESGTPVIRQVDGPSGGPYVSSTGQQITIYSMGTSVPVPNPDYDGTAATPRTVNRNYGFGNNQGARGSVTINGQELTVNSWNANQIVATVPAGVTSGQLVVTRNSGASSLLGVTVTVGGPAPLRVGVGQPYATIQAAIDAANPGDLILVGPGTYRELVIMYKPVQLQGYGAGATTINAAQVPHEKIADWRTRIHELWTAGAFDLLPAQEILFAGIEPALAPVEGAGISVYAKNATRVDGGFGPDPDDPLLSSFRRARIDGFTVEGASTGGGIFLNGFGRYLEVSNNRVRQNSGNQSGGFGAGHPGLVLETATGLEYQNAENDHLRIHNNQIVTNGGLSGAGGGVSLYTGADYYEVTDNLIAGNFSQGDAGGVGHLGRSEGGLIARNRILFNHSFFQGATVSGGGVFIGGGAPLTAGALSEGTGSVTVDANLIQGNMAGAGDGGGLKVLWSLAGDQIRITNNFVVNNVSGLAGAGIAVQDAANVAIVHNTVAHNDSTATAGVAFATANQSTPQPAGIAYRVTTGVAFTAPTMDNNIIWENRSYYFQISGPTSFGLVPTPASLLPAPARAPFWDLGVIPSSAGTLTGSNNFLTDLTFPYNSNPPFVVNGPYFNGPRDPTIILPGNPMQVMPAFDEGGNFIDVRFGPLTAEGSDYHVRNATLEFNSLFPLPGYFELKPDVDGDLPPMTRRYIGADLRSAANANDAPVAQGDSYTLLLPNTPFLSLADRTLEVLAPGVKANDYDPDDSSANLTSLRLEGPSHGTLYYYVTIGGSFRIPVPGLAPDGHFYYLANLGFEGLDSFTYRLSDGNRASVARVTINVIDPRTNNAPAPVAEPIATTLNTPATTRVQPNDPDAGDTHTYAITTNPVNGNANVSAGGIVSYVPNPGFSGADSLVVQVTDSSGLPNASALVTVDITVSLSLAMSAAQDLQVQLPPDTNPEDSDGDGVANNDNVYVLLGAGDGFTTMADGYQQYIFSFHNLSHLLPSVVTDPPDPPVRTVPLDKVMQSGMLSAEFPAPTLKIREGQKLYLNLTNAGMALRPDLFDPHTVHWHGFPQAAPVFDGVPDASLSINMMANFTFFYDVAFPGTYMYHCHVEATEHMQMGMLGNLYVTPKQDFGPPIEYPAGSGRFFSKFVYNDGDGSSGYDVDYPIQIAGFDSAFHDASLTVQPLPFALMKDRYPMLNGRGYPDTVGPASLVPPEANTYLEAQVAGGADPGSADGRFTIGALMGMMMPADVDGAYNGLDLVFTSGALAGNSYHIRNYTGATMEIELDSNVEPAVGDTFTIGKASQKLSSRVVATAGQKVLLRISSLDVTRYYTLASTLPLQIVGWNARLLRGPDPDGEGPEKGKDLYYTTNSVTLGGGESVDAIIDTTGVQPGTYLLYTSNLNYLSNNQEDFGGMMTEIVVNNP